MRLPATGIEILTQVTVASNVDVIASHTYCLYMRQDLYIKSYLEKITWVIKYFVSFSFRCEAGESHSSGEERSGGLRHSQPYPLPHR